jgi:hypothetical protein
MANPLSDVWTKERIEEFLESTKPDSMFPCLTVIPARNYFAAIANDEDFRSNYSNLTAHEYLLKVAFAPGGWSERRRTTTLTNLSYDLRTGPKFRYGGQDEFGRCIQRETAWVPAGQTCANCNCRWLFKQLECVKADLESTKETLQLTSEELYTTKEYLETVVDVDGIHTQLTKLTLCLKDELGEKALSKKAASEAAKAALSASKHITLRLLMF